MIASELTDGLSGKDTVGHAGHVLAAQSDSPVATDVSSLPPVIFCHPNRFTNMSRTAGTNDDPPVTNTWSISWADTPVELSRRSTQPAINDTSGSIHLSNSSRVTLFVIETGSQ